MSSALPRCFRVASRVLDHFGPDRFEGRWWSQATKKLVREVLSCPLRAVDEAKVGQDCVEELNGASLRSPDLGASY